jgi:beta-galactosidase
LAEWILPFVNGVNRIEVTGFKNGKKYSDEMHVNFILQSYMLQKLKPAFAQLNILLGAKRYFTDEENKVLWIPDQPYHTGSWGSVGGSPVWNSE